MQQQVHAFAQQQQQMQALTGLVANKYLFCKRNCISFDITLVIFKKIFQLTQGKHVLALKNLTFVKVNKVLHSTEIFFHVFGNILWAKVIRPY